MSIKKSAGFYGRFCLKNLIPYHSTKPMFCQANPPPKYPTFFSVIPDLLAPRSSKSEVGIRDPVFGNPVNKKSVRIPVRMKFCKIRMGNKKSETFQLVITMLVC